MKKQSTAQMNCQTSQSKTATKKKKKKKMAIKTIVKWFTFCFNHTMNLNGIYGGCSKEVTWNFRKISKDIRLAERALKELKKYK